MLIKGLIIGVSSPGNTENVLTVTFPLQHLKKGNERNELLANIKKIVCALLNTNGGKLLLKASDNADDNKITPDDIIYPVEEHFKHIIGIYEEHNRFHDIIVDVDKNTITLPVKALPILCTLNTYLFIPINTSIQQIPCKEQNALREKLFECRIAKILKQHNERVPEQFTSGVKCSINESPTVQLKHLQTKKNENIDFADRVINNKFTDIISGFANAAGGNIFYGINKDGIVEGEKLSDSQRDNTTKKLEEAVGKMIWQDKSRKVKLGREWDIKFVPVKDCNNETIPSTFVMVVTVNPYIGGVFTKEPESYYLEDGKVKKMPFDIWKRNTYHKAATPVQEMERNSWSSEKNRRSYMKITQTLENFRQFGNWEQIERIFKEINRRENLPVNTKLTCLFQIAALYYYQGDVSTALKYLEQFREDKDSAEDKSVFAVKERYSASAIERSRGNYQEAWKMIEEGLKLAHHAPAGNLLAAVHANAASIISFLVDDMPIEEMKKEQSSRSDPRERIKMGKSFCHHALQHLLYVDDEFEIAREDLKQRIEITLASLCVKLADPELSPTPDSEILEAMKLIEESEKSLMNLKGTERLAYNSCRQMLVKSDLYFQKYKLEWADSKIEHLKKSLEHVQITKKLADDKGFKEIESLCEKRLEKIKDENILNDEKHVEEIDVEELLA